jgi:hypothetical protein
MDMGRKKDEKEMEKKRETISESEENRWERLTSPGNPLFLVKTHKVGGVPGADFEATVKLGQRSNIRRGSVLELGWDMMGSVRPAAITHHIGHIRKEHQPFSRRSSRGRARGRIGSRSSSNGRS